MFELVQLSAGIICNYESRLTRFIDPYDLNKISGYQSYQSPVYYAR
jgi:hypothetical protein